MSPKRVSIVDPKSQNPTNDSAYSSRFRLKWDEGSEEVKSDLFEVRVQVLSQAGHDQAPSQVQTAVYVDSLCFYKASNPCLRCGSCLSLLFFQSNRFRFRNLNCVLLYNY